EPRGHLDCVANAEIRIGLFLADEHHPAQYRIVFHRLLAENLHASSRRELLAGDDPHQRGLAGPVAAKQPGDGPRLDSERDILEGDLVAVAAAETARGDRRRHEVLPPLCRVGSLIMAISVSKSILRRLASASIGPMYCSANCLRRLAR